MRYHVIYGQRSTTTLSRYCVEGAIFLLLCPLLWMVPSLPPLRRAFICRRQGLAAAFVNPGRYEKEPTPAILSMFYKKWASFSRFLPKNWKLFDVIVFWLFIPT
jgi:hypothetical protein